jgi:hypothetical protein
MRKQTNSNDTTTFTCPECGRTFSRAAALGAHRRRAHGVAGATTRARATPTTSARARATSRSRAKTATSNRRRGQRARTSTTNRRNNPDGTVDRDRLLKTLFPNGIPASQAAIHAVNTWLDDAERLARMS